MSPVIPRKRFGQHFLTDGNILDRIINAFSPQPGDQILEIGPGTGALTDRLLEFLDSLTVVELDRDLARILEKKYHPDRLRVVQKDILKFDIRSEFPQLANGEKLRVIGNLPYNISTPLLFHLLQSIDLIQDMTFMLQKEVALRLEAPPGSSNYSRLSVMVGVAAKSRVLFDVPPSSFDPPPKVDSSVVQLKPAPGKYPIEDRAQFHNVVKTAFSQRRKTLRNSLGNLVGPEQFERAEIDATLRAQNLAVEEYVRLANVSINAHGK